MGYNQEPDASLILANMQKISDFGQGQVSGESGIVYTSQSGESGMPVYYENLQRFSNYQPDDFQMMKMELGINNCEIQEQDFCQ